MKFTTLNQTIFKDHTGNSVGSELVEFISPYSHICDGFYEWECGNCGKKHASRSCGWSISGQVLKCEDSSHMGGSKDGCGKMNLLVKTNTDELDKWMGRNLTLADLDKQIKYRIEQLDQYVFKSSLKELVEANEKYNRARQDWNTSLANSYTFLLEQEKQK
jgi:hypothetical protein